MRVVKNSPYTPIAADFKQVERLLKGGHTVPDLKRRMGMAFKDSWWMEGDKTVRRFCSSVDRWIPEPIKSLVGTDANGKAVYANAYPSDLSAEDLQRLGVVKAF